MGNSGKSNGKFGQKQWEIRAKAMGNSRKSNRKLGKKQWENREKAMGKSDKKQLFLPEIYAAAFRVFSLRLPKFSHCFCPNFPIAFARISYCFCLNFPLLLPEFPIAFSQNSGKSNGKIWAKAMRKLGKPRWDIGERGVSWRMGFVGTLTFSPTAYHYLTK